MLPFPRPVLSFPSVLLICMGIALQIQVTLFAAPDYIGLRLSLADLLLPFAGLAVLVSLLRGRSSWPSWKRPFGYWAVAVLVLIICMGLVNGWLVSGTVSRWALVNKFVGWLILMAYLGLGGWIAANARNVPGAELKKFFLAPMAAAFLGILLSNIFTSSTYTLMFEELGPFRQDTLRGLMANRNSYAFFFMFLLTAVTVFSSSGRDRSLFGRLAGLIWFFTPATAFLNLSRALWLCLPPLLMVLAWLKPGKVLKVFLLLALIGSLIIPALFMHRVTKKDFFVYRNTEWLVSYAKNPDDAENQKYLTYSGDDKRFAILGNALELIREKPLLGSGLGAVLNHADGQQIVLDNSLLWVLTEMGAVGLTGFLIVYVCMILALWRSLKGGRNEESKESGAYALSLCALLLLLTFGVFSQFHEILYSRFMWFVLGLALAAWRNHPEPSARRHSPPASS